MASSWVIIFERRVFTSDWSADDEKMQRDFLRQTATHRCLFSRYYFPAAAVVTVPLLYVTRSAEVFLDVTTNSRSEDSSFLDGADLNQMME